MTITQELVERVERGPVERLEEEIADCLGEWINLGGWWREHKVTGERERYTYRPAPACISSVDVAMSLIPPGWRLRMVDASIEGRFAVSLTGPLRDATAEEIGSSLCGLQIPDDASSVAPSLERALTAASLRARMVQS
jgi:hypothetical protein